MESSKGMSNPIDLHRFQSHLKTFYSQWHEHKSILWGSSDAIAIATPSYVVESMKSFALNVWLFNYRFLETIVVFMKKQIHFLCSQKDASLLQIVKKPAKEAVNVDVIFHVKETTDDKVSQMNFLLHAIAAQSKEDGLDTPTIGYKSEASYEKFLKAWDKKLKKTKFHRIDVAKALSSLLAVKTKEEITLIKAASSLTACVMKNFVVPKLWNIIDEKKKASHITLAYETMDTIRDPSRFNCKLKKCCVQIPHIPFFRSGIGFDFGYRVSNREFLKYDSASTIVCAFGVQYKYYCSSIARTFLIDPDPLQIQAYEVLLKAHEAVIQSLRPGEKISDAYQAAVSVVQKEAPTLVSHLMDCAGRSVGINLDESGLNICATNKKIVREGMVFKVSLKFQNLQRQSCDSKKTFSLWVADIVIINKDMTEVATCFSSKTLKDVLYSSKAEARDSTALGLPAPQDSANIFRLPQEDLPIHGRNPLSPEPEEESGHPPQKKQRVLEGLSSIEPLAPQQLLVTQREAPTNCKVSSALSKDTISTSDSTQEVQSGNEDQLLPAGTEHSHATTDPPPPPLEKATTSSGISATYICYKGMFDIPVEDLPYLETGLEHHPQVLNWFNTECPRFLSSSIYTMFAGVVRILRTTRVCNLTKETASHVKQCCLLLERASFDPTWIVHVRQHLQKCQEMENMKQQLEESRRQTDILRTKLTDAETCLASLERKISCLNDFIDP